MKDYVIVIRQLNSDAWQSHTVQTMDEKERHEISGIDKHYIHEISEGELEMLRSQQGKVFDSFEDMNFLNITCGGNNHSYGDSEEDFKEQFKHMTYERINVYYKD